MAHWDNEKFGALTAPKDALCATCKYKLKPITIGGRVYERWDFAKCEQFADKPLEIVWNKANCKFYEEEDHG